MSYLKVDEVDLAIMARFWAKVQLPRRDASKSYCWEWTGAKDEKNYGLFRSHEGSVVRAHRYSWASTKGPIPDDLHVCHRCDNPSCVRPSHLFLGTNAENMADRERKGRGVRQIGESHPGAKLTMQIAENIRKEIHDEDVTQRDLAVKYGVSQHAIWNVLRGNTWVPQ